MTTSLYKTNLAPACLMGLAANRPSGAKLQKLPFLTRYVDDTGVESIVVPAAVGSTTRVWIGTSTDQLTKYWVAPVGSIPSAPYNLPSAAIAAAVADGHTTGLPAVVMVWPGNYTDNVVLQSGIDLVSAGGWNLPDPQVGVATASPQVDVVITGNVSLAVGFTRCAVRGIDFISASNTIDFSTNATATKLTLQNCRIESTASSCITGAPTNTPSLFMDGCTLVTSFATAKAINFTTTVNIFATRCKTNASVASDTAMSIAGGTHSFERCKFFGLIVYTAAAGGDTYTDCDLQVTAASAITMFLGTIITWTRGSIIGASAGLTIAGNGTIDLIGVRTDAGGIGLSIAGTITATEDGTIRKYDEVTLGATPQTSPAGVLNEVVTCSTSGGVYAFTLPAIATIPKGRRVTFVSAPGGANALTVSPAGAELINGTNAGVATSAAIKGSLRLIRGTTGWLVDGAY